MIYINNIIDNLGLTGFTNEIYMGALILAFSILVLILMNFKKVFSISTFIYLLWLVAIAFLAYIGNIIYCEKNNQYNILTLLMPAGIILASFIASASVIRSINATEKLKKMDMLTEHHAQLLYMIHTLSEIRDSYSNIVASNNFAAHKYMFFVNDQKRINVIFENYSTLLKDKYFIFLIDEGYNEFKELQTIIFDLNENATALIGSNFSTKYTLFQKTLMDNLDSLLTVVNKQQN